MKKYFGLIGCFMASTVLACTQDDAASDPFGAFGDCVYGEDKIDLGLGDSPSLNLQEDNSIRLVIQTIIENIQIITGVFAIGAIVVAGFLLVFPTNEETKKMSKSFVIYGCLGFLIAISAEIIVNVLIEIWYSVFS